MFKEIDTCTYQIDSEEEFAGRSAELQGIITALAQEQRARLDAARPEYVWWADAVFFMRDIKGICSLLQLNDEGSICDMLAEVCGKTITALLFRQFNGDAEKVRQVKDDLMKEGELLDALMSKALSKFNGEKEQ